MVQGGSAWLRDGLVLVWFVWGGRGWLVSGLLWVC